MSQLSIRNALENALAAIQPAIDIVYENVAYEPVIDRPYCELYLLFAKPGNPTMGDGFYQELGILQINLQYPAGVGTADVAARAALIRDTFKRGTSFVFDGITVLMDRTPEIPAGAEDEGRWRVMLRIPWRADVFA